MNYIEKYSVYSENSRKHYIVSKCEDGSYACSCLGWVRHYPRINCKHIYEVIQNKPEPLNLENYDKLQGRKVKFNAVLNVFRNSQKTSISSNYEK